MVPDIIYEGTHYKADAVAARVSRIRAGLQQAGCAEGATVAVMARNSPDYVAIALACRMSGIFLVSVNWHFKAAEAAYILQDCGAQALFVDEDFLPQVRAATAGLQVFVVSHAGPAARAWQSFGSDAPAAAPPSGQLRSSIVYTSGTSGKPKGIRRHPVGGEQRLHLESAQQAVNQQVYGGDRGARALLCAPLYHSASMLYLMHFARLGATIVLEPRFDPERVLRLIPQERITHAYMVPTMFKRLLDLPAAARNGADFSSLQQVTSTGSACSEPVKRQLIEWVGPIVCEAYGASETGFVTFIDSPQWLQRPRSVGRPVGAAVVRIVDDAGRLLPPGEAGVIYVTQPATVDFTYIGQPQARQDMEKDGLLTLGDVGHLDEQGYLYISDRKSDMVISGGVNIYPAEIEQVLQCMPGVADCAVFGIPSPEFGESLAAAVQPAPGALLTVEGVQSHLRAQLANYKVPSLVEFHDQLPREDSGKIFKRHLRERFWSSETRRV